MASLKLSVVIGTRDSSQTIEKCLLSLEKQNDRNLAEIIVVDYSTDETTNIVKRQLPNVILIKNQNKLTSAISKIKK